VKVFAELTHKVFPLLIWSTGSMACGFIPNSSVWWLQLVITGPFPEPYSHEAF